MDPDLANLKELCQSIRDICMAELGTQRPHPPRETTRVLGALAANVSLIVAFVPDPSRALELFFSMIEANLATVDALEEALKAVKEKNHASK